MILLQSTKYRVTLLSCNILSISQFVLLMIIVTHTDYYKYSDQWILYAIIVNTIFLIDLIAHIVFVGFKRLMKKKKEYLCELILQIAATIIILLYITVD